MILANVLSSLLFLSQDVRDFILYYILNSSVSVYTALIWGEQRREKRSPENNHTLSWQWERRSKPKPVWKFARLVVYNTGRTARVQLSTWYKQSKLCRIGLFNLETEFGPDLLNHQNPIQMCSSITLKHVLLWMPNSPILLWRQ